MLLQASRRWHRGGWLLFAMFCFAVAAASRRPSVVAGDDCAETIGQVVGEPGGGCVFRFVWSIDSKILVEPNLGISLSVVLGSRGASIRAR
jgi:hypothetical protein